MKKKKTILIVIIIALVIILIGSSYAYFAVNFQKNEEENNTNINTELLSDTVLISNVDNSAGSFLATNIYPGHKEVASIKVNVTGKKDSKIGVKFIYDVEENGLGENVKISIYKSNKKIETNENYFNCQKTYKNENEETKYYEVCEEKDLVLLIGEKVLTGGKEKLEIVTDTIYINDENQAEEYYYYAVVEFLNKETSQNEVMNKILKGAIQVEAAPPERKTFGSSVVAYGRLGNNMADSIAYSSYLDTENLMYDETVDNNLRYVGKSPNNYVLFNDELWRIIGVMNNIDDGTGKKDSRIKLIRNESIGNYSWDTSPSNVNYGRGVNEWSDADLMKVLNPGYEDILTSLYWNRQLGNCFNGGSNSYGPCDFTNTGLKETSRKYIETIFWNTGSAGSELDYENLLTLDFYTLERGENTGKNCSLSIVCNDDVPRTTKWIGKIGLIYPSDYGFISKKILTQNNVGCSSVPIFQWKNPENIICRNNNWLYYKLGRQWTLTSSQFTNSAYQGYALSTDLTIRIDQNNVANAVFPVLFLKNNIQITDGMGTEENPYILSLI